MARFTRTRGTEIHIGTKAADPLTDTYVKIEGVKALNGNIGSTFSQLDVTTLDDDFSQFGKGIGNAGSLEIVGNIGDASTANTGFLTPGQHALKSAADDTSDEPYNFKVIRPNGRTYFLLSEVFGFNRSFGANTNLNEFRSQLPLRQPPTPEPAPLVAPVNTLLPSIAGIAEEDEVLTALTGTWTGSPTFTYQWQRNSGAWADIAGADEETYTVAAGDAGYPLRVIVTATNTAGSTSATSAQTADVPE